MISPADMPKKRPEHSFRPPPSKRVPEWHCSKKGYRTAEAADDALTEIWSRPRGDSDPMEAHYYRCRRRHKRETWHLTNQDRGERAS